MALNRRLDRLAFSMAVWLMAALAAAEEQRLPEVIEVAHGFNKAAFRYCIEFAGDHDSFRVYRLTYASPVHSPTPQNNKIAAEYYLPKGLGPGSARRPAVICLHFLGGGEELVRLQCIALVQRGIPSLSFKLPYYGERGLPGGRSALIAQPKLFATAVQQAMADVRRTVDVLASRPEIDRIGVMGTSLGAIIAASAAGQEPRIARAALLLGGGDLLSIVHQARETQELSNAMFRLAPGDRALVEQTIRQADPLQHARRTPAKGARRPGVDDQRYGGRGNPAKIRRVSGRGVGYRATHRLA